MELLKTWIGTSFLERLFTTLQMVKVRLPTNKVRFQLNQKVVKTNLLYPTLALYQRL